MTNASRSGGLPGRRVVPLRAWSREFVDADDRFGRGGLADALEARLIVRCGPDFNAVRKPSAAQAA